MGRCHHGKLIQGMLFSLKVVNAELLRIIGRFSSTCDDPFG